MMHIPSNILIGTHLIRIPAGSLLVILLLVGSSTLGAQEKEDDAAEETAYILREVVVTATRTPQSLKDIPLSTAIVTRDMLEAYPASNVGDVLSSQSGVYVRRTNQGGMTTASLRGTQSTQVLVVRDGIPVNDAFNGISDLSQLSLTSIERIEIVRGPTSHLYGANALGGVINLITKDPGRQSGVEMRYGSFNTRSFQLEAGGGSQSRGALASIALHSSDGWRGNDDFTQIDFHGKMNTAVGKVRLSFMTGYHEAEIGIPGPRPETSAAYGSRKVTSLYDRQWYQNVYGLLKLESNWGNLDLQLRLRPERNTTRFKSKYDDYMIGGTVLGDDRYLSDNVRLNVQLERSLESQRFLAGAEMILEEAWVKQEAGNTLYEKDTTVAWYPSTRSRAFWTEYIWSYPHFVLVPGVRIDHHSVYGWQTSPSLGIIMRHRSNALRLSMGRAYRAPCFNDLFWPEVGNTDLKSEHSLAFEIGLEREFSSTLTASSTIFRRQVSDMIAWAPADSGGLWQPMNINEFLLTGMEAEVAFKTPRLQASLSYTHLNGQQTNAEVVYSDWFTGEVLLENFTRPAAFIPTHFVVFNILYRGRSFLLGATADYHSEIVNYYPDYNQAPDVTMTEKELHPRMVLDARFAWPIGRMEPFIEVRNALDASYCEQFGYSFTDGDYPMPGRTYMAGLRLTL
ncbi:MAG: TonB-dependent receptor [Fidelibacterota bacterium]|nr:MAG: TonB-dependent receptor [Candidatus Neomarinimicrobiota bacterium]